jgi:hypothetical protein
MGEGVIGFQPRTPPLRRGAASGSAGPRGEDLFTLFADFKLMVNL